MSLTRVVVISLMAVAACSGSRAESNAAEEPWSHAYSGSSDGWWLKWGESLGSEAPYGPGTQFEFETLGPLGIRQTEVIEVISIEARPHGHFSVRVKSSNLSSPYRTEIPRRLAYTNTNPGFITARHEKLVAVTVPAGTFKAGRLWISEPNKSTSHERDEWVVPEFPFPVQSWSRPANAPDLYNPPADGIVPEGTVLTRLVRVDRK